MSEPFIAEIKIFGGTFAPRGYAYCNGALIGISQNQALFALIGTYYGGNGVSTFQLPDLRGRIAVGQGQGAGLSPYTLGEVGGAENTAILSSNMPPHTHTATSTAPTLQSFSATVTINAVNRPSSRVAAPGGALITGGVDSATNATINGFAAAGTGSVVTLDAQSAAVSNAAAALSQPATTVAATGGGQPFSLLQPYLAVNYIIATEGVFPSRN